MHDNGEVSRYQRPLIAKPVFHDAEGRVIDYGNRWWHEEPPEDTYSEALHPERFGSIHAVADALVGHLAAAYDVDVREGLEEAWESRHRDDDVRRVVRVQPRDPQCAPLTFLHTSLPGVVVQAGVLHEFAHPHCGCDACDESLEEVLEELEKLVFAVVDGCYRESFSRRGRWVEHASTHGDGSSASGRSRPSEFQKRRLEAAKSILAGLGGRGNWAPWPERPMSDEPSASDVRTPPDRG